MIYMFYNSICSYELNVSDVGKCIRNLWFILYIKLKLLTVWQIASQLSMFIKWFLSRNVTYENIENDGMWLWAVWQERYQCASCTPSHTRGHGSRLRASSGFEKEWLFLKVTCHSSALSMSSPLLLSLPLGTNLSITHSSVWLFAPQWIAFWAQFPPW